MHRKVIISTIIAVIVVSLLGFVTIVKALQRHTLLPEGAEHNILHRMEPIKRATEGIAHERAARAAHGATHERSETVKERYRPAMRHEAEIPMLGTKREKLTEERLKTFAPTPPTTHKKSPVAPPAHEAEKPHGEKPISPHEAPVGVHEAHEEEDHVVLPEISPIPGVTFVETMIRLMDYELNGRFLGWRPNDLIIGRFTDNVNNFQLGVLEAMRFTTLRLKDSLTRLGEADAYDRDLEDALNLFMNKATQFWFPSAESQYKEAVGHLKKFLQKLKTGERRFYYRTDNLLALIVSYSDLLGNVNRTLIMDKHPDGRPVSWFETDDAFYYAKGVAHVMYEILKVVRVGFKEQLVTIDAVEIMDEILHELHRAEKMDPWIILDGDLDGLFANHRANLNAPLSEAAHLMSIMSRF
ncbi:MAG: DUF2333 family protein [Deltaproteobacteria bacterium]|nr:DUF2333 family protein [Deltaproteobacteria bacterium]MBW2068254.1 DUF2333 family protein [Deltaproteobacteria bacterium]